jgi:hypothetical protein
MNPQIFYPLTLGGLIFDNFRGIGTNALAYYYVTIQEHGPCQRQVCSLHRLLHLNGHQRRAEGGLDFLSGKSRDQRTIFLHIL